MLSRRNIVIKREGEALRAEIRRARAVLLEDERRKNREYEGEREGLRAVLGEERRNMDCRFVRRVRASEFV